MRSSCSLMALAVLIFNMIDLTKGWNFRYKSQITEDFPPLLDIYGTGGPTTEFALGIAQAFDEASGIFSKLFSSIAFKKRIIGMDNARHIEVIKDKINEN